jgi:hypothetical protein
MFIPAHFLMNIEIKTPEDRTKIDANSFGESSGGPII